VATARRVVGAAIDAGILFFDVSPLYGLTAAETILGTALQGRRHEVTLCTKAGRYGPDDFDFSASAIVTSVHASLRRLRTDYVDVLLAHDIEFGDPAQILDETYGALVRLKTEGLCRAIGVSGYPIDVLSRAITACRLDVVLTYCHGTLWDTTIVAELAPVAQARHVRLINASPLGLGLLTEAGPRDWHPAPPRLKHACAQAARACQEWGAALPELALAHALSLPGIDCTLVGMMTEDEVARNARVLSGGMQSHAAYTAVMESLAPVRDCMWEVGRGLWT
jgi:L-galactose dehydrogenase